MVAGILTRPFPDGGPAGIGWKTGTSWGGRDAWAFGFDRKAVVGVWVGRPDGTPVAGATGTDRALPLLARVFDILPAAPRALPQRVALAEAQTTDSTLRLAVSAARGRPLVGRPRRAACNGRPTPPDIPGGRRPDRRNTSPAGGWGGRRMDQGST